MVSDSDYINFGFERMEIALNSNLINENISPKQLNLFIKHLLVIKDSVESDLQDKRKICILILKLFQTENLKHVLALVNKQQKSDTYNTLKECKDLLLLPFNETNLAKYDENIFCESSEMKKLFQSYEKENLFFVSKTVIEWCSELFFRHFNNESNHLSQKNFIDGINTLLTNEMLDKITPIVIGVYSIIFSFGYEHTFEIFVSSEHSQKIFSLEQTIRRFIRSLSVGKKHNIELGVLFGFLETKKSPKCVFEIYILIKEQVLPTKILLQIKEYLLFWKDEDVKNVLEYMQDDKSLERFFLPHIKCLHYSEMLSLYNITNFKSYIKHENKICRKDVYSVDLFNSRSGEVTKYCARDKHFLFLKQLLSLNYNCRNLESIKKTEYRDHEINLNNDDFNDEDNGFPQLLHGTFGIKMFHKQISNADLVYEVFSICDNILLQDVYEKMALCQLAVPVVIPRKGKHVFYLWATRTIKKKWVAYSSSIDIQNHEKFITKQNMATISFCRIGSICVSKSKVANYFLSSAQGWQEHSYFINRDIDSKSILNRGCIESCWYCPDRRTQEFLKDIHCIYNLRGNALKNNKQFQFLLNVSSVIVIIVKKSLEQNVKKLMELMDGFVVVVDLSHSSFVKSRNGKRIIFGALNMTLKDLSKELVELISSFKLKIMNLDDHAAHAQKLEMEIDENNEACQLGKIAANNFVNKIKSYNIKTLKDSVVPLQGKNFWVEWGKIDKEVTRHQNIETENLMKHSDSQRTRKEKVRDDQFHKGASSELIFFIERLLLFKDTIMQHYFINWCQMMLNEMSETHLPQILRDYKNSKENLSELTKQFSSTKNNDKENIISEDYVQKSIDQENNIIKKLSDEIDLASFGCEHIFREFSQIYESHYEMSESIRRCVSFLPKLMADLVILGYPLEILDGDASHIPFIWVKQVLLEVKSKLGKDVNVFVFSILGIQSSGKSTLLNTMFGTKFAVSSGRCTKGVHIQLIPVSNSLRKILNCDYFIVMDSEGLRPPEKNNSFKQDNEIATLIACLSNTTIINFMGQTFSKEMSDILEIALHAYIRMNEVKIKSSCHLIFACISDITAKDKNTLGVDQVFKELNTLIKKIAIEEGRNDLFGGLLSVFPLIQEQFDKLNLTHKINFTEHLPSLWKGNMSPPESTYGETLLQLRDSICNGMMKSFKNFIKYQPLTEFILRINDLWNAIKQENFVFGFKNSQAIQLYKKLQLFYQNELSVVKTKINEASFHLGNEMLHQLDPLKRKEELTKFSVKFNNLSLEFRCWKESIKKNLKEYASSLSDAETALSFLPTFLFNMEKRVNDYIYTEKINIENKIKVSCKKEKTAFKKREDFKKKCLIKAREVAEKINNVANKSCFDTSVIKMNFEIIFKTWIEEARLEDEKTNKSIDSLLNELWNKLIETLLGDHLNTFNMNPLIINNDITESYDFIRKLYKKENIFEYVQNEPIKLFNSSSAFTSSSKETEAYKKAMPKRDKVINETKAILNNLEMLSSYDFVISQILESAFKNISGVVHSSFEFDKNFQIRFLTKLFAASVKTIVYFEEEQFQKNSLSNYLQSKEGNLFKEFEDECTAANSDVCQGIRFIKDILCPIVIEEIKLKVGFTVISEIKKKKMFSNKEIMLYYLHKEFLHAPFDQIMSYLEDYNCYISKWIEKKVINYCLHNEFLKNCITDKITSTIKCFSKVLKSVADNYQQMNLCSWWKIFDENLKRENYKYQYSLKDVANVLHNITDYNFLSSCISSKFLDYESKIFDLLIYDATEQENSNFKMPDVIYKVLKWFVCNPIIDLKEERIGCTAQCPMCGAFCIQSVSCLVSDSCTFRHRTEIHMPQGMIGVHNLQTKRLVTDICSSLICSSKRLVFLKEDERRKYGITHDKPILYKEYQKILFDWNIPSVPDASSTSFWQFLYVKHQTKLAEYYSLKEADDIPKGWRTVTANEASNNLKEIYAVMEDLNFDFFEENDDNDNLCIICLHNPQDKFCFVPCGHASFCQTCATSLLYHQNNTCPLCRRSIIGTQNIFAISL